MMVRGGFNVRDTAHRMGARSVEQVRFGNVCKHVCCDGGQLATMRVTRLQRASDGTMYGMCEHCNRFFYSVPGKHTTGNSQHKQFAYA